MQPFLINYVLLTYEYMMIGYKEENKTILVEAESEDKAKDTLEKYLESKSDPYSTSYSTGDVNVVPVIKQIDYIK